MAIDPRLASGRYYLNQKTGKIEPIQGYIPSKGAPRSVFNPSTGANDIQQPNSAVDENKRRSEALKEEFKNSTDIQFLIQSMRGLHNSGTGPYAKETNAVAIDRLAELTGLDRGGLTGMHDDEITQAYQGKIEKKKIEDLATQQQGQINTFADEFVGRAKTYRERLAESLGKTNQSAFELANPYILEDLNSRGVLSSPTAVNTAQADALKELELNRENTLTGFDTDVFNQEQDLRSGGLSAFLGGNQSALDTALNARREGLNRAYGQIDLNNQNALANSLAKKQRNAGLTNALIGGGGSILGGYLGRK